MPRPTVTPYSRDSIPWYGSADFDAVRALWRDAPTSDVALGMILSAAADACYEFLPAGDTAVTIAIDSARWAQLQQARNTWNASRANPSNGSIGAEDYALTVHPLDWSIKQLLRPRSPIPVVG